MLGTLKSPTPCCTILLLKEMHWIVFCENYCWRNKIEDTFFVTIRLHKYLLMAQESWETEIWFPEVPKGFFRHNWFSAQFSVTFSTPFLSVITLSITQSCVLSRTITVLTDPLASCPVLFFFFHPKHSPSTCSLPSCLQCLSTVSVCTSSSLLPPGLDSQTFVRPSHSHWLSSQNSIIKLFFQFLYLQPSIICLFACLFRILLLNVGSSSIFPLCCFIFLWTVRNWSELSSCKWHCKFESRASVHSRTTLHKFHFLCPKFGLTSNYRKQKWCTHDLYSRPDSIPGKLF